jgi:CRISPR-associated endonuclease/helicase Cas3
MDDVPLFEAAIRALTGYPPFPWQSALYARFKAGTVERSIDIPTGLGKTAVMAIWLLARAQGAVLPRRLIYVVDRRAVVDQATDLAIKLRKYVDSTVELKQSLGLGDRSLPISTLRGQRVDNKEWLEDPASPAIIVGTVDMIGSRLLFEGYGTSRKMRPYHAGLLGADTLAVLDEAHLVAPFEKLLETIANGESALGPRDEALRKLIPPFKLLSLSATGRAHTGQPFGLQAADLNHAVVKRRLDATKRLSVLHLDEEAKLKDVLAEQAWNLAEKGAAAVRIIVFCDKREDAKAALAAVRDRANGKEKEGIPRINVETQLFVGGRRMFEREQVAEWLKEHGFIAGSKVTPAHPTFVFATSAGELGVDLDADHMVSDLVAWERMVQRLGRVNRRGDGNAEVVVIAESGPKLTKPVKDAVKKEGGDRTEIESKIVAKYEALVARTRTRLSPLGLLPLKDGKADASPGAIRALKLMAETKADVRAILDAATTPAPLRPALTRALVDAWSMTSLREHSGRPEIEPWLRGWREDEPPQTSVVWRIHLPVRKPDAVTQKEIEAFFEAAPPHASEMLETETHRVVEWLIDRTKVLRNASKNQTLTSTSSEADVNRDGVNARIGPGDVVAFALNPAGDLRSFKFVGPRSGPTMASSSSSAGYILDCLRLEDLDFTGDETRSKKNKETLEHGLEGATLIVDARLGGIRNGLLESTEEGIPLTVDGLETWYEPIGGEPVVRFRVRVADDDTTLNAQENQRWRQRLKFSTSLRDNGEPSRWLIVEKWLHDSATEDDRSSGEPQFVDQHQQRVERQVRRLAQRLGLPIGYTNMLVVAARLHDEGKRAKRWQRAFNALCDGDYAKTTGPINVALLDGYRHEFGSVPIAANHADILSLPDDDKDLALHIIAAHHGFARPLIGVNGCEDAPPSTLDERARDVALRFARLQKRWGPWGLAWWEALLRAADQQASRDGDLAALEQESD